MQFANPAPAASPSLPANQNFSCFNRVFTMGAKAKRAAMRLVISLLLLLVCSSGVHGQAGLTGQWQTVPATMPINPVHASLTHDGKILIVSGSGNLPANTSFAAGVWDPATNTITTQPIGWDMFCNGMVALPDGRILIVGGNLKYDPFFGWQRSAIFDPATGKFTDMQDMAHGRWYPTATELGDGRVLTFSGLSETGGTNSQVEFYRVGQGWAPPVDAPWLPPLYPRLFLLPNSNVFYAGPSTQSQIFNTATNNWSGAIATTNYANARTYGSAALFPLTPANGYTPKVIIFGGGNPSTATTEIIDLSAATPAWTTGPAMGHPRIEMNATMLPNGKILTIGGSLNDEDTTTASLGADLYDTATNTMGSAGSNTYPRLYHSVSLLLPNGTVWVAGGNPQRGNYENHVEVYSPPYLFNSDGSAAIRPTISSVTPGIIGYGATFQVQTPDAANIGSVVLMKNGSVTHAFDMDQRMVGVNFSVGSGVLTVTAPPNGNIAPPGYYMLFLMSKTGVPSIAKFVQLSLTPNDTPPTGTITSPTSNMFITPGQSVNFAGTGSATSGSITGYSWSIRGGNPSTSTLASPGPVTFASNGVYTASLTVTDSAGNTDPSPPVRTITVTTNLPPTLTTATPNSGSQGQVNLTVNLAGANFLNGATCSFGAGITVSSCTFVSSSQLTAKITVLYNAALGGRNLTVTNPDGQFANLANGFSVVTGVLNPPPALTSLSPNSGVQGVTSLNVTLSGTNFIPSPTCTFGEGITVNSCTYNSATQLTANIGITANALVGASNVTVTNADGQSSTLVNAFGVLSPFLTHIDFNYASRSALLAGGWSFIATTAAGGTRNTEVTSGQPALDYNQTTHPGAVRIQLGSGEDYAASNNSQNMLLRALPPTWTSIRLKLAAFNPIANYQQSGLMVYQDDDNYFYVSRLFANAGSTENIIEIAGVDTNLGRVALSTTTNLILRIDQTAANNYTSYYSVDGGQNWVTIASQAMNLKNVKLAIQQGTNTGGTFPTVDYAWVEILSQGPLPAPTLASVTPNVGSQGQNNLGLSLGGTNFQPSPVCSFGAGITVNSCTFTSSTQITANISIAAGAALGPRNVTVTNGDAQSATLNSGFAVQTAVVFPAPTITSATPNSGMQAQSNLNVTLVGTNFLPAPTCSFGAGITVNSCTYNSATQVTASISIAANAALGTTNITVTNTDGQFAVLGNGFTINFNPTPFTPIRVDAGGGSYTDTSSQTWSPDNSFTGGNIASTASSVSNTSDPALYQTERYGNFTYQFTVPNGNYNVLLKFAEIYWTGAGQRTFNVSINGTQVLTNFDIFAAAGGAFTAIDKTFPVTVTGGSITIQFSTGTADLPKISAIQIAQSGAVSVQVTPPTTTLFASQSQQFTASVTGSSNTGVTWSMNPQVGTLSANGLYTAPISVSAARVVQVTATSQADTTKTATATVNLLPPAGTFAPILVNVGGPAYTDALSNNWIADSGFTGGNVSTTTKAITNTTDPTLYQSERYGVFTYTFTVPAGSYNVTLKFAEAYWTGAGQRTFGVSINGVPVLTNFDIFAAAGGAQKAIDKSFPVTVTGTSITIQFTQGSADLPKVDAISIKQASGISIQINPPTSSLQSGQSQQFSAAITGTTNLGVTWTYTPQVGTLGVSGATAGLYTAPATITSNQTVKITATSVADPTQSSSALVSLIAPFSQILVNSGGPAYTDTLGQAWSADSGFAGGNIANTTKAVTNTTDPTLYQTERYGSFNYQYNVPNGNYNVVLKFAEIYWTGAGQRVFNVSINGTQVLTNFDIFTAAGGTLKAIDKTFPVTVTNNQVNIVFTPGSADLPKVSAIQIH